MRYYFFLAALILTACGDNTPTEKAPPEVFVIEASEQPYHPSTGFNARIQSRSDVDISAQVSGRLTAIHFKEGDQVKQGDRLFDLDPAPFKAALARAKAEVSQAQANQQIAKKNFARGKKLVKDGFISESEFDSLEAKKLESAAQAESAAAAFESAQVELEYTSIKAPLEGKIGRSAPAIGDIVGPQYGPLTTLVGRDDMDLVFQIPEKLLLFAQRPDSNVSVDDIEVLLELNDGRQYPHTGKIDYFSNRVDAASGTVEVRSQIDNPDGTLRPGMYAHAVLRAAQPLKNLMVPQATIQVDQQGTYVLTVDKNNTVVRKNVVTGERASENVLINSGLDAGEQVIIRGVQKARPGDRVVPIPYAPATSPSEG
ncbi:MAG TPA: efflux RND transporter periplasmic adaptor subunit [Marinagarivorans sp.]